MNKRKILLLSLCAVVLAAASVIGTMAFFTDQHAVINTFTVGAVSIALDETTVDEDGRPVEGAPRTTEGNRYRLLPGRAYVKDPQMTVLKGSDAAYVRLLVTVTRRAELDAIFAPDGADLRSLFGGYDAEKWVYAGETEGADNTVTYEFRYATAVKPAADADLVLEPLFTTLTIPDELTGAQLQTIQDMELRVVGHAVQAAGFGTADDAWAAFAEQSDS